MTRERLAVLLTLALALPLGYTFARALSDGAVRHRETVLRTVFGDERFEALRDGQGGFPHYLGDELSVPDFSLRTRDGRTVRMRDLRGKVVVLNFWSTTCPPCLEELPTLEELGQIAGRWGDVEVVAVSTDADWATVAPFLPPRPHVTHLLDPTKAVVSGAFGTRLYPETWLIDRDGIIRVRFDGARDWSDPLTVSLLESLR